MGRRARRAKRSKSIRPNGLAAAATAQQDAEGRSTKSRRRQRRSECLLAARGQRCGRERKRSPPGAASKVAAARVLRTLALVRLVVRWPLWEEAGLGEDESMDAAKLRPACHRRRPAPDGSSRQPRMAVSLSRPAPNDGLSSAAARSMFHILPRSKYAALVSCGVYKGKKNKALVAIARDEWKLTAAAHRRRRSGGFLSSFQAS